MWAPRVTLLASLPPAFTVGRCSSFSPLQPPGTSQSPPGVRSPGLLWVEAAPTCSVSCPHCAPLFEPDLAHTIQSLCTPRPALGRDSSPQTQRDSCALSPKVSRRARPPSGLLSWPAGVHEGAPHLRAQGRLGHLLCFSRGDAPCFLTESRCLAWHLGLSVQCAGVPTNPCTSPYSASWGPGDTELGAPAPLSRGLSSPTALDGEAPWAPLPWTALPAPSPCQAPVPDVPLPPSPQSP